MKRVFQTEDALFLCRGFVDFRLQFLPIRAILVSAPVWRNWQTHRTQNAAGNHAGSSPATGIQKATEWPLFLLLFVAVAVGAYRLSQP